MKLRVLRSHANHYPPAYEKRPGEAYSASERDAKNLIAAGLVEEWVERDDADGSAELALEPEARRDEDQD